MDSMKSRSKLFSSSDLQSPMNFFIEPAALPVLTTTPNLVCASVQYVATLYRISLSWCARDSIILCSRWKVDDSDGGAEKMEVVGVYLMPKRKSPGGMPVFQLVRIPLFLQSPAPGQELAEAEVALPDPQHPPEFTTLSLENLCWVHRNPLLIDVTVLRSALGQPEPHVSTAAAHAPEPLLTGVPSAGQQLVTVLLFSPPASLAMKVCRLLSVLNSTVWKCLRQARSPAKHGLHHHGEESLGAIVTASDEHCPLKPGDCLVSINETSLYPPSERYGPTPMK